MDAFFAAIPTNGVHLNRLPPLTRLHIQTANTVYHVVVWWGTRVYVSGGAFFPRFTAARLDGAWFGGLLKTGWIGKGLRMEIRSGDLRILTTRVRAIAAEHPHPPAFF